MNSLQIALRVLRIDRRTRTSAILTAIGVAVATGLVLLLATLPFATQNREQRALWQGEHFYSRATDAPVKLLFSSSKDYFDGQQITRVDVALPPGATAAGVQLPAGVPQLPGPGETVVSPALGRLLQGHPADQLGDRFGKPVGALGEDGLRFPEQLVALSGHTADAMPESANQVPGFPAGKASADALLMLLSWVGIIVLLVPSLVLVASSARLTAARRERRLAAIRLAGATPGQVTNMVAAETTLSAGIGALLGLLISPALHGLASFVPWAGGTWLAADFTLPVGLTVFIVVAIPVLVVLAGVLGLRRVLKNPLFATGGHTKKPLRWWRLLALPAAGLFFLVAVTTAKDFGGIGLVMAGLFFLVGSAAIVGPWVTSAVGGTFVRIWRRPSALLAGRRLRDDPKGAYRASAGIVLAVFAGSMALTLLPTFESMAGGGRSFVDSVLYVDTDSHHAGKIVDQANASLRKYGQADKAVAVGEVYLVKGEGNNRTGHRALVMSCADAVKLTRFGLTADNCTGGPAVFGDSALDLAQYQLADTWEGQATPVKSGTRAEAIHLPDSDLSSTSIIDPAALPDGFTPKYVTVVAPTTDANREIVRTALAGPAAGEEIGSRDQYLFNQQTELGDLRRVTVIGLLAAGILAGCSAAVATAGSVMDRRRTFGALMAAGTPVRVLARALRMEAALPALVATIGAGIVGVLVGVGLYSMVDERGIVLSPWLLAPVVLGVGVALLGASVCTPALKRVQAEPLADE
ncbi:ABC-type lipoprotein release transport system permease subunit [Amycolatopsis lexingtonensis]|uniref:ABC-type lipoprotein release transport system permease subunit n=1 Tax=Amycolatopsis lexingtonensis TaxID=218822 RepID=A0ABR9I9C2_9PSEU|nr:ABC transporter permease [Amycolatopsis lexingtonensis]MBE1499769.1 ABC-type lipoprotein release transport system permease subunit [Amycolatopsis lexingtonensis]